MNSSSYAKATAREAAYLALLQSQRQERFIDESLEIWDSNRKPSQKDFNLAKEIASGACRRALTLDYYANALAGNTLSVKRKERSLLHTALYQYYFMDRIPLYALANETIEIAKKYCHSTFIKFLNTLLRKLETSQISLPKGFSPDALSVRYSYPTFFVEALIKDYGIDKAIEIMEVENKSALAMARIRRPQAVFPEGLTPLPSSEIEIASIESTVTLQEIAKNPDYYIQNITPALLIHHLAAKISSPEGVLDLCASPGGKLIAIHDKFPSAKLYGNDLTADKLTRLQQNLDKYNISAHLSYGPGECYPKDEKFDLIILDVPCSNTGVLNKRPEARWRLTPKAIEELKHTQIALVAHAITLLKPHGELWYMTCSILKEENEGLIEELAKKSHLKIKAQYSHLPTAEGHDGGFGCSLTH